MRVRRLHKRPAALEVTAFINLIVVLVPFLLSTAVFSRLSVLELTLPAQSNAIANLKGDLQLEVVIRPEGLNVGDKYGGQILWIANTPSGYDYRALSQLMYELKARFPDKTDASILAEPGTPYDVLVGVMDAVRETRVAQGTNVVRADLFPDISIGDAPIRVAGAGS